MMDVTIAILIIELFLYVVLSGIMAGAILLDVKYKGNSYVDCLFVNILLFLFGFVVWPILVVVLYTIKLYKAMVKELTTHDPEALNTRCDKCWVSFNLHDPECPNAP
jgi:hypothetical protein